MVHTHSPEKEPNFELYKHALENKTLHKVAQQLICRKLNEYKSISVEKIAVNFFDNKGLICSDGITTFSFGHTNLDRDAIRALRNNCWWLSA